MSEQKWLNCRLSDIRQQLEKRGHRVSKPVISRLLREQGYSLRANRKQAAGKQHPERDQQFQHLQAQRAAHQAAGHPTISVDTKKKELVGNFKNAGRIWCQEAEVVDAHDFPQDAIGRPVPYGMYDTYRSRKLIIELEVELACMFPTSAQKQQLIGTFLPTFSANICAL